MSILSILGLLFVAAGLGAYAVIVYNGMIALRNDLRKAWANIDVLLKQRNDQVPMLVEVCKGYMRHEQETLERLAQARTASAQAALLDQKMEASRTLSSSVQQVFLTAERYPELKADGVFLQLQESISELENQIADRREFYNDAVNLFNTRIQQAPDAIFAWIFRLQAQPMFQASAEEKLTPRIATGSLRR